VEANPPPIRSAFGVRRSMFNVLILPPPATLTSRPTNEMKIRRTSNSEHRTSNIECGSQSAAHSFGVRRSAFDVQCFDSSATGNVDLSAYQ